MQTQKYSLAMLVLIFILCISALSQTRPLKGRSQIEPPLVEDGPFLLIARPYPALSGIEQLYVVIVSADTKPNKNGLIWKELQTKIESKLKEAGLKIAPPIREGHTSAFLECPEMRIYADILKLKDMQQCVFRIQTSLARKVYLTKERKLFFKADVWNTVPVIKVVTTEKMPNVVTGSVLKQVETFIHAYHAANQPGVSPSEAAKGTSALPIMPRQPEKQEVAKYVASKNSEVFHRPDCRWAKKIAPQNLITYKTRDEAIKAGKRPCKVCNP